MHPLQIIFIAMMLCVLAYLTLNVVGWVARRYIVFGPIGAVTSSDEAEEREDALPEPVPAPPLPMPVLADTGAVLAGSSDRTSPPVVRGISRKMSDVEITALLSIQRTPEGQYRFSANKIFALVGGTRDEVLGHVRAIRNLPQYPVTTPEQQATRDRLELPTT